MGQFVILVRASGVEQHGFQEAVQQGSVLVSLYELKKLCFQQKEQRKMKINRMVGSTWAHSAYAEPMGC